MTIGIPSRCHELPGPSRAPRKANPLLSSTSTHVRPVVWDCTSFSFNLWNLIQASARRPAALFLLAFAISKYGLARGISDNLLQRGHCVLGHVPQYHPSCQIRQSTEAGPELILGPWVQIPFPRQPVIKGKQSQHASREHTQVPLCRHHHGLTPKSKWWWCYLWNERWLCPTLTVQFYYFWSSGRKA